MEIFFWTTSLSLIFPPLSGASLLLLRSRPSPSLPSLSFVSKGDDEGKEVPQVNEKCFFCYYRKNRSFFFCFQQAKTAGAPPAPAAQDIAGGGENSMVATILSAVLAACDRDAAATRLLLCRWSASLPPRPPEEEEQGEAAAAAAAADARACAFLLSRYSASLTASLSPPSLAALQRSLEAGSSPKVSALT